MGSQFQAKQARYLGYVSSWRPSSSNFTGNVDNTDKYKVRQLPNPGYSGSFSRNI